MKANIAALASGLLFGVGLVLSGMTQPSKVQGFLDVTGSWDPSLMFVMAGGIGVHFILHRLVTKRAHPLFDKRFHLPTRKDIDGKLVLGAALFGVGWGLGGYCPGPGLVSLGSGGLSGLVFVATMVAGFLLRDAQAKLPVASQKASAS